LAKQPSKRGRAAVESGAKREITSDWVRAHPSLAWVADKFGMIALAPVLGLFTGFLLLWSGMFLGIAWQVGPQPFIEHAHYESFTGTTTGRIVESWGAIEFDPADLPADRHNWTTRAKITRCATVAFEGDWGESRRAFCGSRFGFRGDFTLYDWDILSPGVPVAFPRDESGFALQEIRVDKRTLSWLASNPPDTNFPLSKPPPSTALDALREQFDRPFDVAFASWTKPFPVFPLRFDPKHPEAPMPAQYVEDRQNAWLGGWVFAILICIPGLYVWRIGMRFFFAGEPSRSALWLLTLLPLLALPWWGEALPKLIAHVNRDWASIASDMFEDLSRTTRMVASDPADATLAGGERVVWHLGQFAYAETFGRIRFTRPETLLKNSDDVRRVLGAQAAAQVAQLTPTAQVALFARLLQDHDERREQVQSIFTDAAEAIERDPGADPALHRAARRFLLFAAGYSVWDVDALEKSWASPANP